MGKRKSYKIFDINYLLNEEFTEDDLYYLFDTQSLNYSLIIEMFKRTNQELTDEKKIINKIKKNNWVYNYFWNDSQRNEFEDIVSKVYKNLKCCGINESKQFAQWWIFMYGFTNEKLKNNKNIDKLCDG